MEQGNALAGCRQIEVFALAKECHGIDDSTRLGEFPHNVGAHCVRRDRQTAILFSGDTLYPGRLYVHHASAFTLSVQRLVDFTHGKIVAHILGNHIEQSRTAYLDYAIGTVYQPDEHSLELGRAHLLELNKAVREMNGQIRRMAFRDCTIWPE